MPTGEVLRQRAGAALWVGLLAYLGVFVRIGLTYVSLLAADSLLPRLGASFFLPNIVGSFLLGFLTEVASLLPAPLHTGITSGFCGSCTTFATWQLIAAAQILGGRWIDSVLQSLLTFSTSYIAMFAGFHSGDNIRDRIQSSREKKRPSAQDTELVALNSNQETKEKTLDTDTAELKEPAIDADSKNIQSNSDQSRGKSRRDSSLKTVVFIVVPLLIAGTTGVWLGVFLDTSLYRCQWWVAVAFAPLGALTRYLLSLRNPHHPNFPWYTFLVNIAGTILNMLLLMLDNEMGGYSIPATAAESSVSGSEGRSSPRFWIRFGISAGAMGSLSTVSTWVSEIFKLSQRSRWFAYRYALASLLAAQLSCLALGGIWIATGKPLKLET